MGRGMMAGMLRRWVIRSVFIALFALCAGGWGVNYFQSVALEYFDGVAEFYVAVTSGSLEFGTITLGKNPIPHPIQGTTVYPHAWQVHRYESSAAEVQWYNRAARHHFAGFALDWFEKSPTEIKAAAPLWLFAVLSAALLWLAWRKTRSYRARGAFPVEPGCDVKLGDVLVDRVLQ